MAKHPEQAAVRTLPATRDEMLSLGWDRPDIVLITGDAYVDGRVLSHFWAAAIVLGYHIRLH
jgi:3',5'-cyclic AMP phosphodiesterase CpdA